MRFRIKSKFPFKKIRNFLKCYCYHIAGLIFILLALANLIIYASYVFWPVRSKAEIEIKQEKVNEELFQKATDNINARVVNLERVKKNDYPDPFK